MLCQRCKKRDATVFSQVTVNGIQTKSWLCTECANAEEQSGGFASSFFSDLFKDSLFGMGKTESAKRCPLCGSTASEIASRGRAGCSKCYEVFSDVLDRMVYNIHGQVRHIGSPPGGHAEVLKRQKETEALKKEQQEAIARQDYERAAELRDKIKALSEGNLPSEGDKG